MDMVERVGAAIKLQADYWLPGETHQAYQERFARAAIEAMRDPTREMFVAAFEALVPASDANACWRAMIDAALSNTKGERGMRERDANGWMPIESAPKDGEAFLAWDGIGITLAWFTSSGEFESHAADGDYVSIASVTHWQPLPEPPVQDDEEVLSHD